jgi:uncharacterized protein YpmS
MSNGWKIFAIILLVILILENAFIIYAFYVSFQENERKLECYYDVCEDYADAYYDVSTKLCGCYDEFGDIQVRKRIG